MRLYLRKIIYKLNQMSNSEDLLVNSLINLRIKTKKKMMMSPMFKLMKRRHPSPKKECSHGFRNRYIKTSPTIRRLRKLFKNISTQWIFQTKAYSIAKQNALCKSRTMSMHLKMKFLVYRPEMFELNLRSEPTIILIPYIIIR